MVLQGYSLGYFWPINISLPWGTMVSGQNWCFVLLFSQVNQSTRKDLSFITFWELGRAGVLPIIFVSLENEIVLFDSTEIVYIPWFN